MASLQDEQTDPYQRLMRVTRQLSDPSVKVSTLEKSSFLFFFRFQLWDSEIEFMLAECGCGPLTLDSFANSVGAKAEQIDSYDTLLNAFMPSMETAQCGTNQHTILRKNEAIHTDYEILSILTILVALRSVISENSSWVNISTTFDVFHGRYYLLNFLQQFSTKNYCNKNKFDKDYREFRLHRN